jgi:hypothetical protein
VRILLVKRKFLSAKKTGLRGSGRRACPSCIVIEHALEYAVVDEGAALMIPNICIYEQLMFERVQEWQKEAERQRLIRGARVERKQQRNASTPARGVTHTFYTAL